MGMLVNGKWQTEETFPSNDRGQFIRRDTSIRNWVTRDGAPGRSGNSGFRAEPGRYHLYVALACPWAHRTLIFRQLKRLQDAITVSIVDPFMGDHGWSFTAPDGSLTAGSTPDHLNGSHHLFDLYVKADPAFTGRVTVPILWDKHTATIVNNESSEIIRMLNGAFDDRADASVDLYPPSLRPAIDEINAAIYANVNNGVYRCGFARTQAAYEEVFAILFRTLDDLEARLSRSRYLTGDRITEADWRLFPTLVRFDAVYYSHFKCNLRRIIDYPNLWGYTRELYQWPGVAATVDLAQIKRHYYASHASINPTRIVPQGPTIDFMLPHDRSRHFV